jgi:hypothetical protein
MDSIEPGAGGIEILKTSGGASRIGAVREAARSMNRHPAESWNFRGPAQDSE